MCGRFVSCLPPDAIGALFASTGPPPNLAPSWNVAPTQDAMVIRRHPDTGKRQLDLLHWGLVPAWTKDVKAARKPINARSETASGSRVFSKALASRRCLVPADAFYEWRAMPDGMQPYAIARQDGAPVAFAGIWERWWAPDGEIMRSFAVLTTSANSPMQQLHERMPVILEAPDWSVWLGETGDPALEMMRPAADDILHFWPVSRAVNDVRNNGADLLDFPTPPPSYAPPGDNPA